VDGNAQKSTPAPDPETASSFLIERKQNLTDLAPQDCLVSSEAVERKLGGLAKRKKQRSAC
jgi:hypothetical protein